MVLKLYGIAMSHATKRVGMVLYEKRIPFELITVDMRNMAHKKPEYLAKQPFGSVPYLDDDGYIVYESRAICGYLEAKYPDRGPRLAPSTDDLKKYGAYQQALNIEAFNFDPAANGLFKEKVIKKLRGTGDPDPNVVADFMATLNNKLDAYDAILSKQKYLAGDELTLADLFHLPYASVLPAVGCNYLETKPNVARWFKDISSRESWLAVQGGVKGILE
ncbi:glutathione S-transferase [Fistulina hepatica ATCC 64428]|uniref:glutathione transferase n=1 Tax=Fistulina hepatica ATCC 64428 TaxID=1128425 RepID=A0A0D7ANA1_9AGAR|nr:glutathione S-transferase [Fistulina hepatica ATCC 64428]